MSIDTAETTIDETTRADLAQIEEGVTLNTTLADLIRIGSQGTKQSIGWGEGETACAWTAASQAAERAGLI